MSIDLSLELSEPIKFFPQRVSRRSAKKSYWNQISDFLYNSEVPDFDDSILIGAVEDCAEWKRYTELDVDDIEILYERNNGKGKVLSTLSSDDEDEFIRQEIANFKIENKLWVLSGLYQAPYTDKKKKFEFALPQGKGLKVLNTVKDFKLPWNIYCPTIDGERNIVKWKHGLKRNQWLLENPFIAKKQVNEVCHCLGKRCGSLCLNRSIQVECTPYNCKFGDQDCGNRAFADLMNAYRDHKKYAFGCEVLQTEKKGCGLLSIRSYNIGSLVVEYTGEVINLDEVEHRLNTIYKDSDSYYFLGLEEEYVIDAGQKGSVARFANHSCSPNAEMQKWYVDGEPRIGLFAKRYIEAGEEITYDYNFEWFENGEPQKCYCGAKNCQGFIGKGPDTNEDDSDNEPNAKRGIKVSHPSRATTIQSSESSSDSDFDDFDQVGLVEALENFNHDYDNNNGNTPAKTESKPEPANDQLPEAKHVHGVNLKEVVVKESPNGKKKNSSEGLPPITGSSKDQFELQSSKLKQPEQKTSNIRGSELKDPAVPKKAPAKTIETKKPKPKNTEPITTDNKTTKVIKSSSPPKRDMSSSTNDKPAPKRTSRRSQSIAIDDFEVELTPQMKKTLAINMAPPGGKTDLRDQLTDMTQTPKPKPKPTSNSTKSASPPKRTTKAASSTSSTSSTSSSLTKKRSAPSNKNDESIGKRRKLIIDSESDDEPISKHSKPKPTTKNGNTLGSSTDSSGSAERTDSKPLKDIKPSPSLSSKPTPSTSKTVPKKESVFAKRKGSVPHKIVSPDTSSPSPATKPANPVAGSDFFNLKKAKRRAYRTPVQTTDNYESPVTDNAHRPAESSELVVHETAQNYPQPAPYGYDYQYDNWNGYYDDSGYYGYYYGDRYYPQPPPPQGQSGYPPQPPYNSEASEAHSTAAVSSPRQNVYPEGYYPSQRPPHPSHGYPYYPPPPIPPQRGYGYGPPPPQPIGYPPWQGYPPPPQPHSYQAHPGGYPYSNANTSYPPGAFTTDAENEMLVESPQEGFTDEVLETPAEDEHVLKREETTNPNIPGAPADPRKRKK